MKKRALSLFLALLMVFSMLPVSAFAEEAPVARGTAQETTQEEPAAEQQELPEELPAELSEEAQEDFEEELEPLAALVAPDAFYVNANWAGLKAGAEIDGKVFGTNAFANVQAAVDAIGAGTSEETVMSGTVMMLSDSDENVVISRYQNITLDLNGYVLSGVSDSVIKNGGTLEIKDSNSGNQTHNFKVGEDNLWTLTSETEGAVAYENLTDRPEAGAIVTVTGGCITGGTTIASGDTNGGGILNNCDGKLMLSGGTIVGNKVAASDGNSAQGGGVYNGGTFEMNGGMIAGNLAYGQTGTEEDNMGGGVHNVLGAVFTMNAGIISDNKATGDGANTNEYCYGYGGGVCTDGTFTMNGGTITENTCDQNGGGILVRKATGATVGGTLTVKAGNISSNTAEWGAGITVDGAQLTTIEGGTIRGNTASSGGGAICVRKGETHIIGGTFTGNTARTGGGVYAFTGFTIGGNTVITGNTNTSGKADNVYIPNDDVLITICDYTGTCGVKKYGNTGVISTETDEKYVSNFISDNENYVIRLNDDNRLEISTFKINISQSEHGAVTASKSYATAGSLIVLSNTPEEGYVLEGYTVVRNDTGAAVPIYDNYFFMPASDVTVTVTFAELKTITNVKPDNGSVTINGSDAATVAAKVGSEVTLGAAADAGYALKEYHVYKTGDESTTVTVKDGKFTMPDYDVTVTADFERGYGVTVGEITGGGTITADKKIAKQGETVTLTVTPKANYEVSWVKVNGSEIEAVEGVYAFIMPAEDVTVTVAFEGWGNLTIGTSVTNATTAATDAELTFTLTLTGEDGQTVAGEYTYTTSDSRTGKIKSGGIIPLKDGQTATITDLPAEIVYEVTEDAPDGFSVIAISGSKGVINAGQTAQASFTNIYTTEGSVQLKVTKTLTGRALQEGQFSFQLLDKDGNALRTAACVADGTVTFGTITYGNADNGKTYTYYIRESVPDDAKNADGVTWASATDEQKNAGGFSLKGYTYDSAKRKVEVSVTDNGNGTMTTTATYYNAKGEVADSVTNANVYHATGEATLSLWTTLKARNLKADEFTFGLYEANGTTPVKNAGGNAMTATNAADGTVEFRMSYNETDIGKTYTYVIKEIVPATTDESYDSTVVYDTTPWTFEVAVKDNGDGTLSFTQTVKDKDDKTGVTPIVKNTLQDGSLSVEKTIDSGDAGQEFRFIVKFTSPTDDSLDGDYTLSREEIVTAPKPKKAASTTNNISSTESITPMLGTAGSDIGNGICGGCDWVIDASGCLTIKPTNGISGTLDSCTSGYPEWGWYDFDYRTNIKSVKFEPGVKAGEGLYKLFGECSSLTSVDLTNLDTSDTTIMSSMFNSCTKLTNVSGLSTLDTSKVTNVASMFATCSSLETLDLSGFDTSSVTTMMQMFNRCSSLETLTFKTKTSSKFVTSNVTDMRKMFNGCTLLQSLDLSGFDTSKITNKSNMQDMFGADSIPSTSVIPCAALRSVTLGANFSFIVGGTVATKLPTPTAAGYSGKWKWNGTGKTVASLTAADLAAAYPDDATAPAGEWVWEESTSYTVTFNGNSDNVKGSMTDMTCEPGIEYTLTANTFYRLGYIFTGWNTKANGSGTAYADGATIQDLGTSTLYAQWKEEGPVTMKDGQMEVTLHGNECLTINNVPAGTRYQVYEETPSGWVLVSQSGTSGVIEPLTTAKASFCNDYRPTTAQAAIVGTVTMDSSAGKVSADSCSFVLKYSTGGILETVSCGAGGSIAFSPITYTAAGTYAYTVSQVIPGETGYIEYDNHTETVTVTVTDDGTGNLSSSVAYDETGVVFNNRDKTPTPQGTLQIQNTVKGTSAADKDFTFTVVTVSNGKVTTQTKTAKAGETVIVGKFDAGTTYTITETGIPAGYALTSQTDAKGTIADGATATAIFTNTYAATGKVTLRATNTLKGGTLAEGQFSFVLKEGDTTLQTVGCTADGSVTFRPISYTVAGKHTYTISEEIPDDAVNTEGVKWAEATPEQKAAGGFFKNNVEYDSHTENVTVEASDNGEGGIIAKITYDATGAEFTNIVRYSVTAATCSNGAVSADKTRAAKEDTVTVTAKPAAGFAVDKVYYNDGTQHEITLSSDGSYTFSMPAKAVTVSATFKHSHSWTYTVSKSVATKDDNDTITAACINECTYGGIDLSLTIQAPTGLTYDGSAKCATFGTATTFLGEKLPTITYQYKATEDGDYASTTDTVNAGYYKASFTVGGKTAYVTYEIAKAASSLTILPIAAENLTYNGNAQKLISNTPTASDGTIYYAVGSTKPTENWTTTIPQETNAGTYIVWYKVVGDTNYTDISPAILSVTIVKATVDVPNANTDLTYNGNEQTGVTLPDNAVYTLENNKATNAGSYTATASLKDGENYEWKDKSTSEDRTIQWSIAKASLTATDFTFTAPDNLVYSGTAKAASVETSLTGVGTVTVSYFSDEACETAATPTNANTYYVGISVAEGTNYNAAALNSSTWKFKITRADQSSEALVAESTTTTSITLKAVTGFGKVEYGISNDGSEPASWQESTQFTGLEMNTKYYFFVKFAGDDNHNAYTSTATELSTLNHAHSWCYTAKDNVITAKCTGENTCDYDGKDFTLTLTASDAIYDGKEHGATISESSIAGQDSLPTIEYYKGETKLEGAPTATGEYTAKITIGTATAVKTFSIVANPRITISGDDTARHTDVKSYTVNFEGDIPLYSTVVWDITGGNYEYIGDHIGTNSVSIICEDVGTLHITATLVDYDGRPILNSDGEIVRATKDVDVKADSGNILNMIANFIRKILSSFRKLFG